MGKVKFLEFYADFLEFLLFFQFILGEIPAEKKLLSCVKNKSRNRINVFLLTILQKYCVIHFKVS